MNANMIKLHEMIKETNSLINKINTETEKMKSEYNLSQQQKLDDIIRQLQSYESLVKSLNCDVEVKLKSFSRYMDGSRRATYVLRLIKGNVDYVGVTDTKGCWMGHLPYNAIYEEAKSGKYSSNLSYEIDDIIKHWDSDDFEKQFIIAVQNIITRRAELANKNYEYAMEKLLETH